MLDLRKAFDFINYSLLLKKLEIYDLSETTLGWFNSYLWMRNQAVAVNRKTSNFLDILRGLSREHSWLPSLYYHFYK